MSKNKPASPDLASCTEDNAKSIRYEFALFDWLPTELPNWDQAKLPGTGYGNVDQMHFSALLEAFLIHTRVLLDFFGPTRSKDDFLAIDFVSTWNTSLVSQCPSLGVAERDKLNKMVAHPSARRQLEKATTNWDYSMIHGELSVVVEAFKVEVRKTKNAAWFP